MRGGVEVRGGRWGRRPVWAAAIVLALLAAGARDGAAQDSVRTTRLVGRVVDSLNARIAGATIELLPARTRRAVSNDSGTFVFDSVPVGLVQLSVRRLGYAPATFTARLRAGRIERVTLELSAVAFELPRQVTVDTVAHPWLRTFERRREHDSGIYFTRQDIVRSQVRSTSDLLRRVPGVDVQRTRFGTRVVFSNNFVRARPCEPQIFVHAMNYSGNVDDFQPDDIEAMEVYPSISTVPVELQTARAQSCGAIVIWTREPPPAKKK
ncbi:MAG TPA: carboxypeptidase regulatory-like domain-containing protein [Gemmatimonadaceae bacterium]